MGSKGIRFIVYAITLCVLYAILGYLDNRDNTIKSPGQNDLHYIVKMPGALKYIYLSMFILGIIMFFTFFISKLRGNPTATDGHIRLSLVISSIGLLVMIWAAKWKIIANEDQLEIHRLFHKDEILLYSEIERVETGSKEQIILYKNNKKIVTVDALSDNYDCFRKTLQQYGKVKSN